MFVADPALSRFAVAHAGTLEAVRRESSDL
jgi:hypothetical protein